ncbi:MFS transporter [Spirillospora sp. NPDC049652]
MPTTAHQPFVPPGAAPPGSAAVSTGSPVAAPATSATPRDAEPEPSSPTTEPGRATFFLVSGNFAAFTFINPLLREVAGLPKNSVGALLLLFGAAGIAGNFLAGMLLSRDIRRTILILSLTLAAVLALFPLVGANPVGGVALLVLWGLAFGGIPVSVQTWILRSAPDAAEAATALNTSLFNLAIALGALFGGLVVDHVALRGVLWLGAVLILGTSTAVYRARQK